MKTTHILLAAVLAATSAVQAATAEHKLPAPLPEFKTPEQLVVWRKAMMAKAAVTDAMAAKQATSASSTSAFYTGKPFVEEARSYSFKCRNYDPELNRWTSVDPSGFPDGPNNSFYSPNPTSEVDFSGLAAKSVINNLSDALEHWSSNAGGTVAASDSVDSEIRNYSSYGTRGSQIENVWKPLLAAVPKSESRGFLATRNGTTWGVAGPLTPPKTVGSVDLTFPAYSVEWTTSEWMDGKRMVMGSAFLSFSYNDDFNFVFDPNNLNTIFTDVIPKWWTGSGTPFQIVGHFDDSFIATAWQYE